MLAVFTFDAASVPLLERLLAEGKLPALAELRRRGTWYPLEGPATHFAAGAYQTLYSGHDLREHGLYFPFQWSASEQRLRYFTHFSGPEAVWERAARAGADSLVVDPYESRVPRVRRGAHLSGWQFANRFILPRWSDPPNLHRQLARLFGRPPLVEEVYGRPSPARSHALHRHLAAAPARGADAALHLLAGGRLDLLWFAFASIHIGGHQLWSSGELPSVYEAADAALERLLDALPTGADVLVVSPVGMGANTSRSDLLPDMLAAVLTGRSRPPSASWIWKLRDRVPVAARDSLARLLPGPVVREAAARLELRGVDWRRTPAFTLPSDQPGFVRLNVRGREKEGIVDPSHFDALAEQIRAGLLTFRDPDGAPAVRSVDRVSELFGGGPGLPLLPDLVVRWSDRPAVGLPGVTSPQFGDVRRRGEASGRSGNHTEDAWVLIVPGRSRVPSPDGPPRVVDVTATVCSLLGAPAEGLSGRPLLV